MREGGRRAILFARALSFDPHHAKRRRRPKKGLLEWSFSYFTLCGGSPSTPHTPFPFPRRCYFRFLLVEWVILARPQASPGPRDHRGRLSAISGRTVKWCARGMLFMQCMCHAVPHRRSLLGQRARGALFASGGVPNRPRGRSPLTFMRIWQVLPSPE